MAFTEISKLNSMKSFFNHTSGTGFSTTMANNIVTFGGFSTTVTAATATSLTVTLDASAEPSINR